MSEGNSPGNDSNVELSGLIPRSQAMGRLSRCLVPQLESVFDCLKMLFLALVWSEVTLCLMEAFLFPGAAPLNGKGLLAADGGTEGGLGVAGGSLV